jgi:tartrate/fumarate subfamily iron-sulfur-dependent hydro-lyase beta chain
MNAAARSSILLTAPFDEAAIRALPLGVTVRISGTIYTGRDRVHRYLFDGGESPVDLRGGALFHCGPVVVPEGESWRVVAAGPTTSIREEPYMASIIARHGIRVILGKGGMGAATQTACREHGCVYIQTVGGAAAWIAQCVRRVGRVWFEREFGATEAMWEFTVEGLIGRVAIDARGESLFAGVEAASAARLRRLLAGNAGEA